MGIEHLMLEELAIKFINEGNVFIVIIAIGFSTLGFIAALVTHLKSKLEIMRSPYFAFIMLLGVFGAAAQFIWVYYLQAIQLGILWLLVTGISLATSILGYLYGVLSVARSRDAFANGWYALLALIPLVNFALLLKWSRSERSPNQMSIISLFSGFKGVLSGLVMMAAAAILSGEFRVQIRDMPKNIGPIAAVIIDPMVAIQSLIRTHGLEQTLKGIANETGRLPIVVNEVTKLVSVEVEGNRLRRTYVINWDDAFIDDQDQARIERTICAQESLILFLREGATIEEVYVREDGSTIGHHIVTPDRCGV